MKRLALFAGLLVATVLPSDAYYHFVHYLKSGSAPEKFDIAALPGKTVTFLISGTLPAVYSKTDSLNSVVSQIQQAAAAWNSVGSSDLRVAFGGFASLDTLQTTAGGDVVFEDLPPGVEGFGGPTSRADAVTGPDGLPFVPIVRSVVHLSRNLTLAPGPSYGQSFLLTLVHEMGHALGLQHTFTASAMSQDTIRATSIARLIENDDIAGLTALYPAAGAFSGTSAGGSITGRVRAGGRGVHLASVVVMRAGVGSFSAFTDRDGNYRIDGLPEGQFFVYAHALPPDANVVGPWDADDKVVPAGGPFNSLFYPGTTDLTQAWPQIVTAGKPVAGIDFNVTPRNSVPVYNGQVFGYLSNNTVANRPAPVAISGATVPVAASVTGLGANGRSPGLAVQFTDPGLSIVPNGIVPSLSNGFTFVYLYLKTAADTLPGAQHIVFNTPDYMYVLPSAMRLTLQPPPALTGLAPNADGSLTVTGSNFAAGMQIYFDSLPGTMVSLDTAAGSAVVLPPTGSSGQQSTLVAYTPDGQNSQLWKPTQPVTHSYGSLSSPSILGVFPSGLPAGAEGAVEILGANTSFSQTNTSVGFGSSDILVRKVTVLSPTRLRVNIAVSPAARAGAADLTVTSGFAFATTPAGFQIYPAVPNLPAAVPDLVNFESAAGITGVFPGATVTIVGRNLAQTGETNTTVVIGGRQVRIVFSSSARLNVEIPLDVTPGTAQLVVNNGVLNSSGVDVMIDPLPATFEAVQNQNGDYVSPFRAARVGETLIATVSGYGETAGPLAASRIRVKIGGVSMPVTKVQQVGRTTQITFSLTDSAPLGASQRLIVYRDGLSSVAAAIPVAAADGSLPAIQ